MAPTATHVGSELSQEEMDDDEDEDEEDGDDDSSDDDNSIDPELARENSVNCVLSTKSLATPSKRKAAAMLPRRKKFRSCRSVQTVPHGAEAVRLR